MSDTKRNFLENSATIFDPLGLLSPFVMKIKLLFQKVWLAEEKETDKKKKGWDTKLPADIQKEWNGLKAEIPVLNTISIPRCFFTMEQKKPGSGNTDQISHLTKEIDKLKKRLKKQKKGKKRKKRYDSSSSDSDSE